ncbi:hypothetical protein GEMRC1_009207 [Eukaryota sp. GEM-RC1]
MTETALIDGISSGSDTAVTSTGDIIANLSCTVLLNQSPEFFGGSFSLTPDFYHNWANLSLDSTSMVFLEPFPTAWVLENILTDNATLIIDNPKDTLTMGTVSFRESFVHFVNIGETLFFPSYVPSFDSHVRFESFSVKNIFIDFVSVHCLIEFDDNVEFDFTRINSTGSVVRFVDLRESPVFLNISGTSSSEKNTSIFFDSAVQITIPYLFLQGGVRNGSDDISIDIIDFFGGGFSDPSTNTIRQAHISSSWEKTIRNGTSLVISEYVLFDEGIFSGDDHTTFTIGSGTELDVIGSTTSFQFYTSIYRPYFVEKDFGVVRTAFINDGKVNFSQSHDLELEFEVYNNNDWFLYGNTTVKGGWFEKGDLEIKNQTTLQAFRSTITVETTGHVFGLGWLSSGFLGTVIVHGTVDHSYFHSYQGTLNTKPTAKVHWEELEIYQGMIDFEGLDEGNHLEELSLQYSRGHFEVPLDVSYVVSKDSYVFVNDDSVLFHNFHLLSGAISGTSVATFDSLNWQEGVFITDAVISHLSVFGAYWRHLRSSVHVAVTNSTIIDGPPFQRSLFEANLFSGPVFWVPHDNQFSLSGDTEISDFTQFYFEHDSNGGQTKPVLVFNNSVTITSNVHLYLWNLFADEHANVSLSGAYIYLRSARDHLFEGALYMDSSSAFKLNQAEILFDTSSSAIGPQSLFVCETASSGATFDGVYDLGPDLVINSVGYLRFLKNAIFDWDAITVSTGLLDVQTCEKTPIFYLDSFTLTGGKTVFNPIDCSMIFENVLIQTGTVDILNVEGFFNSTNFLAESGAKVLIQNIQDYFWFDSLRTLVLSTEVRFQTCPLFTADTFTTSGRPVRLQSIDDVIIRHMTISGGETSVVNTKTINLTFLTMNSGHLLFQDISQLVIFPIDIVVPTGILELRQFGLDLNLHNVTITGGSFIFGTSKFVNIKTYRMEGGSRFGMDHLIIHDYFHWTAGQIGSGKTEVHPFVDIRSTSTKSLGSTSAHSAMFWFHNNCEISDTFSFRGYNNAFFAVNEGNYLLIKDAPHFQIGRDTPVLYSASNITALRGFSLDWRVLSHHRFIIESKTMTFGSGGGDLSGIVWTCATCHVHFSGSLHRRHLIMENGTFGPSTIGFSSSGQLDLQGEIFPTAISVSGGRTRYLSLSRHQTVTLTTTSNGNLHFIQSTYGLYYASPTWNITIASSGPSNIVFANLATTMNVPDPVMASTARVLFRDFTINGHVNIPLIDNAHGGLVSFDNFAQQPTIDTIVLGHVHSGIEFNQSPDLVYLRYLLNEQGL